MALKTGAKLQNGQYEIAETLGRGGFGCVYRARDTLIDEDVAIKELIPGLSGAGPVNDEQALKRFITEARATMRLRHDRIVRTHSIFAEDGGYYIVMEFLAGGSLESLLEQRGMLPVEDAVQVAAQISEGLHYAHTNGIIHCDLKPGNILFRGDYDSGQWSAAVADFGIAHVSGEMLDRTWRTQAGFSAGTLPYMSPEQADGLRDDPRVDVYAVGAVLYRMLTGRTYLDFDLREVPGAYADNVLLIRGAQPLPPSRHNPAVSRWLDAVVLAALAKRAEDRFASAGELREALLGRRRALPRVRFPAKDQAVTQHAEATPAGEKTRVRETRGAGEASRGEVAHVAAGPETADASAKPQAESKTQPRRHRWLWPVAGAVAIVLAIVGLFVVLGILPGFGRETPTLAAEQPRSSEAVAYAQTPPALAPALTDTPPPAFGTEEQIPTPAPVPSETSSPTPMPSATPTRTGTPTRFPSATWTSTRTPTATDTPSPTARPTRTRTPTPTRDLCPSWYQRPKPGKGVLVIENHVGVDLRIEQFRGGTGEWTPAAKQGDVPGRLVFQLSPGVNEFMDYGADGWHGHILLNVEAGKSYVSPIWHNNRYDEFVYPLAPPPGCE